MRNRLVLGVSVLLVSAGIASAQARPLSKDNKDNPVATPPSVATPNKQLPETTGQSYRDDRLQSDRDSGMVPTPVQPRNSPDPNPLPGEEPRPIPR